MEELQFLKKTILERLEELPELEKEAKDQKKDGIGRKSVVEYYRGQTDIYNYVLQLIEVIVHDFPSK